MASAIMEKATMREFSPLFKLLHYAEAVDFANFELSLVRLLVGVDVSTIAVFFVVSDIALIDCSRAIKDHTATLHDICANAPLAQKEKMFFPIWDFRQLAIFSRSETHLSLFSLCQINESFQLLEAIYHFLNVSFIHGCSKAHLLVSLDRLFKLVHPAKHALDANQPFDVA